MTSNAMTIARSWTPPRGGLLLALASCGLLLGSPAAFAAAKCKIQQFGELPITMNSLRPIIAAKINGKDAKFVLDSGAFYSMMSEATAAEYGLKPHPGPFGLRITGIGGSAGADIATVKEFSIVGKTIKDIEFLVGGSEVAAAGLLGQNFLERWDVEYDLAKGVIRLFHTEDCENTLLAYWLTKDQAFSMMAIDRIEPAHPHTIGAAYVNGQKIRVMFDTGAFRSMLSLKAAARAGVTPGSPGVVFAGYASGIGRGSTRQYIAPFANFQIGDGEEIKNTKLRIAELNLEDTDMLIGADFFLSHRVFVANREHRMFFSYNGGPVFNLDKAPAADQDPATATADAGPDAAPAADQKPPGGADAAPDAAEWARRGSALAARRDFTPALVDLSKAVELSPDEAEYYFERANAYWGSGQQDAALADFDKVIALKQDFEAAYIPRAEIKLAKHDVPGAMADLDALDLLAAKPSSLRLQLAELYERVDRRPAAIAEYTLWIDAHPDDSRMATARGARCYSRALANQDLPQALSDCNTALHIADKTNPNYPILYVDRGFVRLRQGDYPKAIEDFGIALKQKPDNAFALYGRAVAESRLNQTAASAADLHAAQETAPKIAERLGHYGISP